MIHSLNERSSKLEFKSDIISVFRKNKISEVVRVTNEMTVDSGCTGETVVSEGVDLKLTAIMKVLSSECGLVLY